MTIPLSKNVQAFPVRHGRAPFAMELRKLLWNGSGDPAARFDAFAFALPASLRDDALEGVEALPSVRALVIRVDGEVRAYMPFDPCDAYVEALRQARQRRLPVEFLEDGALLEGPLIQSLPDAYLAKGIGLPRYYDVAKGLLAAQGTDDRLEHRSRTVYAGLRAMEKRFGNILLLCDFPLLTRLQDLFQEGSISAMLAEAESAPARSAEAGAAGRPADPAANVSIRSYPVKPGLLYFALGEIPFYAGEMEKERLNPMADPQDYLDLIKKIFVETRNRYVSGPGEAGALSIKKIQAALVFLRNMAVQQGRLTPDLLDVVTAAKGVFGNAFAAKVLEAARHYPFFDPLEPPEGMLEIGRDRILEPEEGGHAGAGEGRPSAAFNLLEDEPKVWKTINLKKEPDREKQRRYRYSWDPRGMCSHTPEDERIEGFNRAVRRRSQDLDPAGFARAEKLTSSLKDGIDIRETLRNWTTGGIYVREIPPAKGRVDTVVIVFDEDNDERYPSRTTWYAEHNEESTLTFYATDPLAKLIGPGIAESEYGGLSLLFPPRPVRNVFEYPPEEAGFRSLAEQLLYGGLLNSGERSIAYVSARKPGLRMKRMAAGFKKRLVWVPLAAFSAETLRRLRKFHILNGKEVRAWAARYIPE